MKAIALSMLTVFAIASTGEANAYFCTGKVKWTSTSPSGAVHANIQGPDVSIHANMFCSVSTQHGSISPSACKQILNTLRLAQLTKRDVTLAFDYATPNSPGICNFPSWVDINNGKDWYYGPAMGD
jgi:hypothetical protein